MIIKGVPVRGSPMKRLNGWQRIGVVLSVAWIIGGWLWFLHLETEAAVAPSANYMRMCGEIYQNGDPADQHRYERNEKCMEKAKAIPFLHTDEENMISAAIQTFVLLGLAWLLVYILVWIGRWVRTGFKQSTSQP
jgi:hypothetical protein